MFVRFKLGGIICKKIEGKPWSVYLILVFLICSSHLYALEDEIPAEMPCVFFNPDTATQNPTDAALAAQTFLNYVNKKQGWTLKTYYFKKQRDLVNLLDRRKVYFGVLSHTFLVENHHHRNIKILVRPLRNGKTTYREVIVVKKDTGYTELLDLKGKRLAATALGQENISFYNDVIFLGEIDVQAHFQEIRTVDSANSALLAVLYGDVEAAAVTYSRYLIMKDLNPQINTNLTTIFASAEIPISPFCYFDDNVTPQMAEDVKKILLDMHNTPFGRNILMAFQVEAFEKKDVRELELELLSAYQTRGGSTEKSDLSPSGPTARKEETAAPAGIKMRVDRSEEDCQLVFRAWITDKLPNSTDHQTMVTYCLDNSPFVTREMELNKDNSFESVVELPPNYCQSSGQQTIYTVKAGDTLGKIARKFFGNSNKYNVIALYNDIKDPNIIFIGQPLRLKLTQIKVVRVNYSLHIKDKQGAELWRGERTQFIPL
ncbi:PhnD/SsuA/transferrin family substrate-binding protein [candidate division CSSED10-310 bacterium]|uniref:PhnD/SsuA/transferrin family substrate-binding protein n=1 Tax=candidate division CSSED10-310 bacterium TaxID=2855610 RepID=A0ABV6YZX3_UNCC1